ncbi:YfbM family protein [Piscinibacter terrae]|uniref:YfbM family protein n=1 Tax=Piscinibacter terrae TaxID=2496871 RepID=UPI0013872CAF|nr:YfbM family protein [Albitalea terrae]
MNRRQLLVLLAGACTTSAHASVVFYMAAVNSDEVPALDANARKLGSVLLESSGNWNLYLDKAWDGLHWILTGAAKYDKANPLSEMLRGGSSLATQLPYGKPKMHSPRQVKAYARRLAAETDSSLRGRYDPAEMDRQNVYPGDWADDPEEGFAYLLSAFRMLQSFTVRAAKADKAILCCWG